VCWSIFNAIVAATALALWKLSLPLFSPHNLALGSSKLLSLFGSIYRLQWITILAHSSILVVAKHANHFLPEMLPPFKNLKVLV
jgi:hypothetical protein